MQKNKFDITMILVSIITIAAIIIFTALALKNSTSTLRENKPYENNNTTTKAENNSDSFLNIDIYNNNVSSNDIPNQEIDLSSFSTNIYDNDTNRVYNIALAIEKINNFIIEPNQVFSFNETVGPMDFEHGFKESTAFDSEGNKIKVPRRWNVSNK